MSEFAPVIIIELFLVFGGVVVFAWWQFRDLRKEREKRMRLEEKQAGKDE
jgi:cbb3-type cytochrome oxidase subunit 3